VKPTITSVKSEEGNQEKQKEHQVHQTQGSIQQSFEYDNFFQRQILQKKKDHSYRIFKKVARFADQPPFAHNYASLGKDITVWCSNDYLGMTAHPKVRGAVM